MQGAVGGAAAGVGGGGGRQQPLEVKKKKKDKASSLPVLAFTPTNKVIKMDHYNINKNHQADHKKTVAVVQQPEAAEVPPQPQPKHIPGDSKLVAEILVLKVPDFLMLFAVWRIRIILVRIRIQGIKKLVTDSDPDQILIRIGIQAKTMQIWIQAKQDSVPGKSKKLIFKLISHFLCVYITGTVLIPFL